MYDDMLNKLERIKGEFVDEETIHSIFRDEKWEFMVYEFKGTKIYCAESPMGNYIFLEIELSDKPNDEYIVAPNAKIKIKNIIKHAWRF